MNPYSEIHKMASNRLSKKRTLEKDNSLEVPEKTNILPEPSSLIHRETKTETSAPYKKPRHLAYREPENLPSLDPEAFNFSFDSQCHSELLPPGLETWTSPISTSISTSVTNLESLGDIIQKYNNATLDSIKNFNIPVEDFGSNQKTTADSVTLLSSVEDSHIICTKSEWNATQQTSLSSSAFTNVLDNQIFEETDSSAPNLSAKKDNNNSTVQDLKNNNEGSQERRTSICSVKKLSELPCLAKVTNCQENPNHVNFFSPSELKVKDLPREIQHEDSVTFFTCMSQLVVQISVNVTSSSRSSSDKYKEFIGTNKTRYGSGFVGSVDEHMVKFRCKKPNCFYSAPFSCRRRSSIINSSFSPNTSLDSQSDSSLNTPLTPSSSSNSKHFYYSGLTVHTSRLVIFDKLEAENAYVKFFYENPDEKGVVQGHVAAIVGVNILQDHVTLHVMSHDKTLLHSLSVLLENAKSSYSEMQASTMKAQYSHDMKNKESWVAVISHPHGLSKAITFGRIKWEVKDSNRFNITKYYNAPVCDGGSGALVITPMLLKLQWPGAVHSSFDPDVGLNFTLDSRS
ncbi:hypothetical protein Btru_035002 [Bulinus truncatus]|nr:hypothetical protein Btru_035002 [Bulinus truncatus]